MLSPVNFVSPFTDSIRSFSLLTRSLKRPSYMTKYLVLILCLSFFFFSDLFHTNPTLARHSSSVSSLIHSSNVNHKPTFNPENLPARSIFLTDLSSFFQFAFGSPPITRSMTFGGPKKRHRATGPSDGRHLSTIAVIDSSLSDKSVAEVTQTRRRTPNTTAAAGTNNIFFNDSSTADVILRLFVDTASSTESSSDSPSVDHSSSTFVYLHSDILRRSNYFSALLSDRWMGQSKPDDSNNLFRLNLSVPSSPGLIQSHLTVLELLYTNDFADTINSASTALDLLAVALELLFEDCTRWCVTFLEAVPWTEEEEKRVLNLLPFLSEDESKELLARVSPVGEDSCELMLKGLILSAIHNYQNMAYVKAFVAKILRDFSSRESAKRVLEKAFNMSLKTVKESLEEYSSPDFRGDHNETEAIQRLNLHKAMTNGKHLLWLVERMIELRVADTAVKEWSEQAAFTADLQRAFRDDAWRNIAPGLPAVMLRCTCKLANAVAAGSILATRPVYSSDLLGSSSFFNSKNLLHGIVSGIRSLLHLIN